MAFGLDVSVNMVRFLLSFMRRVAIMVALTSTAGCLVTEPVQFPDGSVLTPPRLVDQAGVTRPRLNNVVVVLQPAPYRIDFRIPVEDDGLNDPISYAFFVDQQRDCVSDADGGLTCDPQGPTGTIEADGNLRRVIVKSFNLEAGCRKVELWVTSSRFLANGNFHTPERAGDVASATWWVFVPPMAGVPVTGNECNPVPQ